MTGSRPGPGGVRRLARRLGGKRSAEAARALAETLAAKPDAGVRELARNALAGVSDQPDIDAICDVLVATGDSELQELARQRGWSPSDPGRRALVLFLLGEFDAYAELDHDGSLLAAARTAGDYGLRERLARQARAAGRADWVRAAATGTRRPRLSDAEWDALTAILAATARWDEMWRLARQAPPAWSVRMLAKLDDQAWRPAAPRERPAFDELATLARECARQPFPSAIEELASLEEGHDAGSPRDLLVTPDGAFLTVLYAKRRTTWDLRRAERISEASKDGTTSLAMTPDGGLLAIGDHTGQVKLERVPYGLLKTVRAHSISTFKLAITPDGSLLASIGDGWTATRARLWRLPSGEPAGEFDAHGRQAAAMAISPDSTLMAIWCGREVRLWRLPSGEPAGTLPLMNPEAGDVSSLVFTPDGRTLVAVRDAGWRSPVVQIWRLPECELSLSIPVTRPCCCAVSPDGRLLAIGGDQDGETLWRLPGGDWVGRLSDPLVPSAESQRVAFTPDGRLLVSSRADGTWPWSVPGYEPGAPLPATDTRVLPTEHGALLVGPDAADGGRLRVWRYRPSPVAELARKPVAEFGDADVETMAGCRGDGAEGALAEFALALVRLARAYDIEVRDTGEAGGSATDIEVS